VLFSFGSLSLLFFLWCKQPLRKKKLFSAFSATIAEFLEKTGAMANQLSPQFTGAVTSVGSIFEASKLDLLAFLKKNDVLEEETKILSLNDAQFLAASLFPSSQLVSAWQLSPFARLSTKELMQYCSSHYFPFDDYDEGIDVELLRGEMMGFLRKRFLKLRHTEDGELLRRKESLHCLMMIRQVLGKYLLQPPK
jgi:hypothetical protein